MRYLVDTHIFLWWLNSTKQVKKEVTTLLQNPNNHIYISVASLWEISIKHAIGKLPLKTSLSEMVSLSSFSVLPIQLNHILTLQKLPLLHNDPFDRIIISQALTENLTLITDDERIKRYKVKTK